MSATTQAEPSEEAGLAYTPEQEKNMEVARRINRETRADPSSPYSGKYIAVSRRQVVAAAATLDELVAQMEALGAPEDAVYIQASVDYDTTYFISPWF